MSDKADKAEVQYNQLSPGDKTAILFSNLIMQQFSMAMMLMGRAPGPDGQPAPPKDLEAAHMFIDQIEMLENKTKGNLTKDEEQLLKQVLMTLRMTFVEAVDEGAKQDKAPAVENKPEPPKTETKPAQDSAQAEESHKKFSKKY